MTHPSKPIVFFGSGPVAKASLAHLAQHFSIESVVTKPVTERDMAEAAPGIPVKTVSSRQELDNLMASKPFQSELGIIVDFGIIVSRPVIDYFSLGIINSHFSLLPEWRGADPITFSILSGQSQTGVSLMLIVEALDEGDLLAQENLLIAPHATGDSLTHDLVTLSNDMLTRFVPLYQAGKLQPYPQDSSIIATYSRKLTKEDGRLDWSKPATQLEREIRAFAAWPKSVATLGDLEVVVTKAHVEASPGGTPGSLVSDGKKTLGVATTEGVLALDEVKPAGKGVMSVAGFLAGYKNRLPL